MNVPLRSESPINAAGSAAIGRKAVYALYAELTLYPKPGLVSPVDNGAHSDMDMRTFMRSLHALRAYFCNVAEAGARQLGFQHLQDMGLAAERRMLAATGGVNTHRGAIFTLGLLSAGAAALLARNDSIQGDAIGREVAARWGSDILACAARAPRSNGIEAANRYGVGGARRQAAAGFPLLFNLALPALKATLPATCDRERALVQTLFTLMSVLDDTNLLHRGGAAGLEYVRMQAQSFLDAGGVNCPHWRSRAQALHTQCVARHLSPGGAADLLAAAVFIHVLAPQ